MKRFLLFIFTCLLGVQGVILAQQKAWSLEDCIKYAIENNIQIKQQVVQTNIQKNSLDLSKFKLLPTANGQATHTYSFGRALDQNSYQYFNQTILTDYFYFGGSLPLFSGLQNYNTIRKNQNLLQSSELDIQNITDNVALNVALGYLQVLLNKELVSVNENQLNITLQQIEKTRKLVDAGSVARGNLLQIEAQAAQEELSLITARNQLETSTLSLTQFLELKTPAGFEVVVPQINIDSNTVITGNIDDIYAIAEKNRPEIKSSELKLKASEYGLKIARGSRSPVLSFDYSLSSRYTYLYNVPNESFSKQFKNNKNSGAGVTLTIPILNGWQANKSISNARLNVQTSQYSLEGEKKQLYKNIQQAYTDAVAALKKYAVSMKAIASAEESFRYTEQKFDVGLVTPVDYNSSKTQLLKAQSDMFQAKYEFIFKTKVLDFYKGLPLKLNQ